MTRLVLALVSVLLLPITHATAAARKPSGTKPPASSLSVAPNPVLAGADLTVAGCGFAAGQAIILQDLASQGSEQFGAQADATGCFAALRKAGIAVGDHTLEAYQYNARSRLTLVASARFTVAPPPLSLAAEDYHFQWDSSKQCTGEDDQLNWKAVGYLDASATFTFTPKFPECDTSRAVMVKVQTDDPSAQLELSTTVPVADAASNNPSQAGTRITTLSRNGVAQLCMFLDLSFKAPSGYAIQVRNPTGARVSSVTVTGMSRNDWQALYWSSCLGADADKDGTSDSVEHSMAQLIYPTGNYVSGDKPAGTDYLRACGTPTPNDEFDPWRPDLDDDGVITQKDFDAVAAHLGEGNGVPGASITPEPNEPSGYWNHTGGWNRFDLDADGRVASADVELVRSQLGARCQ